LVDDDLNKASKFGRKKQFSSLGKGRGGSISSLIKKGPKYDLCKHTKKMLGSFYGILKSLQKYYFETYYESVLGVSFGGGGIVFLLKKCSNNITMKHTRKLPLNNKKTGKKKVMEKHDTKKKKGPKTWETQTKKIFHNITTLAT
jgi:hypothetical protein